MRLGFIGVGTIAASIVEGLCADGAHPDIVLSPRNAEAAARLAAEHPRLRVADSNQAVLDASDVVIVAVRPQIVDEVLRALRFRPDHHVVSLVATVTLAYLREATSPAGQVTRAVPIPSVARRQGPTAVFPPAPVVTALFDRLGSAIPLEDEAEFDLFTTATAAMAAYFAFADTIGRWMERGGIAPDKAFAYVRQMLEGLATAPGESFAALAGEHQTHGGLNEQVVRAVAPTGIIAPFDRALDDILARLRATPAQKP